MKPGRPKHIALRWSAQVLICRAINMVLLWSTSHREFMPKTTSLATAALRAEAVLLEIAVQQFFEEAFVGERVDVIGRSQFVKYR
jgi:hypothetical protein